MTPIAVANSAGLLTVDFISLVNPVLGPGTVAKLRHEHAELHVELHIGTRHFTSHAVSLSEGVVPLRQTCRVWLKVAEQLRRVAALRAVRNWTFAMLRAQESEKSFITRLVIIAKARGARSGVLVGHAFVDLGGLVDGQAHALRAVLFEPAAVLDDDHIGSVSPRSHGVAGSELSVTPTARAGDGSGFCSPAAQASVEPATPPAGSPVVIPPPTSAHGQPRVGDAVLGIRFQTRAEVEQW